MANAFLKMSIVSKTGAMGSKPFDLLGAAPLFDILPALKSGDSYR